MVNKFLIFGSYSLTNLIDQSLDSWVLLLTYYVRFINLMIDLQD
jgi:hypothetical protein